MILVPLSLYFTGTIGKDYKNYTITFEENGGSEVKDITARYNSEIKAPSEPTKEH